jgi:hypothetical protein
MAMTEEAELPSDISHPDAEKGCYEIADKREVYGYIYTEEEEPTMAIKAVLVFFDEEG